MLFRLILRSRRVKVREMVFGSGNSKIVVEDGICVKIIVLMRLIYCVSGLVKMLVMDDRM